MQRLSHLDNKNIVFFDGVCNMCNSLISYLIKKDKNKKLYYSSLQSEFAKQTLKNYNITYSDANMVTIYFLKNGVLYDESTAILKVFSLLSQPYSIFAKLFLKINTKFRNIIYRFISKNRYRIFGKKDTCRLPTKEEKEMFLE